MSLHSVTEDHLARRRSPTPRRNAAAVADNTRVAMFTLSTPLPVFGNAETTAVVATGVGDEGSAVDVGVEGSAVTVGVAGSAVVVGVAGEGVAVARATNGNSIVCVSSSATTKVVSSVSYPEAVTTRR